MTIQPEKKPIHQDAYVAPSEEALFIQALTQHLRQQALLQHTTLPRWARF